MHFCIDLSLYVGITLLCYTYALADFQITPALFFFLLIGIDNCFKSFSNVEAIKCRCGTRFLCVE